MENRHGLCVQAEVTSATGVKETTATTELLARQLDVAERPPQIVGADKGYHNAQWGASVVSTASRLMLPRLSAVSQNQPGRVE